MAFAWFALAVAVILGIVGFLRPLWASPNSNVSVVHIGAITAFPPFSTAKAEPSMI
jgi:hypothetical protein